LREDPKRPSTHYYLGVAQETREPLPEAKAAFVEALDLNSRLPDVYVALARVYMAQGEHALALEALAKAAELNPDLKK